MRFSQDLIPSSLSWSTSAARSIWSASKSLAQYADQFSSGWPSKYISKVYGWVRSSSLRNRWGHEATWVLTFLGLNHLLQGVTPRPEGFYYQNLWLSKFTFPREFYLWADKELSGSSLITGDDPASAGEDNISLEVSEGETSGEGARHWQLRQAADFLSLKARQIVVPGCGVEFLSGEAGGPIRTSVPIKLSREEIALPGISASFKEIPLFGGADAEGLIMPLAGNIPVNSFFRTYLAYISASPWMGGVGFRTAKELKAMRVPLFPLDSAICVSLYLLAPSQTSRYHVLETLNTIGDKIHREIEYFKISDLTGTLQSIEDIHAAGSITGNILASAGIEALKSLVQSGGVTSVPLEYSRYIKSLLLQGLNPLDVYRSYPLNVQEAVSNFVEDLYDKIGLVTFQMLLIPTRVSNLSLDYSVGEPVQTEIEFLPLFVMPGFRTPGLSGDFVYEGGA